jgi:hypothetical protein
MEMTHYMGLLAANQPWNLILFMAIPVILAETIAICELYLLYTRNFSGQVKKLSRYAGMFAGAYMLVVFLYLTWTAFIPLTMMGEWKGIVDVIAVGCYLLAALPLIGIGAMEFGLIGRGKSEMESLKLHATFVAIFLVLAHVAMIFGMVDPTLFGWSAGATTGMEQMHSM